MEKSAVLLFAGLFAATAAGASVSVPADLPRVDAAAKIDGVLDDEIWANALKVELSFETSPGENTPASVETWAYIAEDGQNLYVAFDARDPRPDEIRAYLRDRDTAWADDIVGINFDTYNDNRRAFEFWANPLGVQLDSTFDDTIHQQEGDSSWDAIWDSAGRINDNGYVVEMKIPLDQLRFPDIDGKQTWGYRVMRQYPRQFETWLENIPTDRDLNCQICQNAKLTGLEGSKPGRDFEIVPTITALMNETTDDPGVVPLSGAKTDTEAGITMRYGITPDITANLAINPDFSQIEADASQLDINQRFALFFPEKRPFFLEGGDYFTTPMQAIFTRTVASPDVGVKLTGKRNNHTFGTYSARDEFTNLLFPGSTGSDGESFDEESDVFVGRYSYGFGDSGSYIGGVVTARDAGGIDYRNVVAGIDGRWRINDNNLVTAQFLTSESEYSDAIATEFEQPFGSFDGDALAVNYRYESRTWFGGIEHLDLDSGFRADSGFMPQVDLDEQEIEFGRRWWGDDDSWWTQVRWRNGYEISHRSDGQLLEEEISVRLGVGGPLQSWTQIALIQGKEYDEGTVFDVERYGFYNRMTPISGLTTEFLVFVGERVDFSNSRLAESLRVRPSVVWNATRNLQLRVNANFLEFDTLDGEMIFDAKVIDARAVWQFNVRSFLRLTVQNTDIKRNPSAYIDVVDSRSKDVGRQLLYSWKLNPQTVFFLGYSDAYIEDDSVDDLTATDRTWFMKVGYAWSL